jgi:hypothetical protein
MQACAASASFIDFCGQTSNTYRKSPDAENLQGEQSDANVDEQENVQQAWEAKGVWQSGHMREV